MKTLGTILPTKASIEAGDRCAADNLSKRRAVAAKSLSHCERRYDGGENRYYESATRYAIVDRSLTIRWFEVRADGDYAVRCN